MIENDIEKAKKMFKKDFYSLKQLKNNEEWNKLNVPNELIIFWVKENIDKYFSEIEQLLIKFNLNNQSTEEKSKSCLTLCIIHYLIDEFNLDCYYEKLVSIYEKINYDDYLLISHKYEDSIYGRHNYLCQFWIMDKESVTYSSEYDNRFNLDKIYHFDTKERFFGLLPIFYKTKRMDLFYRLLGIAYDFISNIGVDASILLRDLYNYSKVISDDKLTLMLKKAVVNIIKLYVSHNDTNYLFYNFYNSKIDYEIMINNELYEFVQDEKIHFDKEKEIEWAKRIFYSVYTSFGEKVYNVQIIYKILFYYNIDLSIISTWRDNISNYYESQLSKINYFYDYDTSFVNLEQHSFHYIEYLKKIKTPYYYICTLINYYFRYSEYGKEKMNVVNYAMNLLHEKDKFEHECFSFDIFSRLIDDNVEDGYLIKYYKENKELFNMYKSFLLETASHMNGSRFRLLPRIYLFAQKINDSDILNAYKKDYDAYVNYLNSIKE